MEAQFLDDHIRSLKLGRLSRDQNEACNEHLFFDDQEQPASTLISRAINFFMQNKGLIRVAKFSNNIFKRWD